MIPCTGAPGVNTSDTPSSFSSGMSTFGIVPPTTSTTSSAPSSLSSSAMRGTSVMCALERLDDFAFGAVDAGAVEQRFHQVAAVRGMVAQLGQGGLGGHAVAAGFE